VPLDVVMVVGIMVVEYFCNYNYNTSHFLKLLRWWSSPLKLLAAIDESILCLIAMADSNWQQTAGYLQYDDMDWRMDMCEMK